MLNNTPEPPLTLRDAEEIVRKLAPALHEHGGWVRRIQMALACRTAPDPEDLLPDSHLRSAFGRWLAEEKSEHIRRHPEYLAASDYHRRAHELARGLCQKLREANRVDRSDYDAFTEVVDRLDRSIDAMVKELWDLLRHIDPLTGVATRFAMLPRLKQERERIHRTGRECSICMVDLDHFKAINDTFGHQAGDAVLEQVSNYLSRNLRRYDQVCRFGGEEFVLMLPDTTPEEALPVVDRLREGLARQPVSLPDGSVIHVTASFGIAPLNAEQSVEDSIDKADKAMYVAKQAGRNLVRVWHEG
jgi:diguanylate cyclase (GGDEF)-like protein